MKLFPFVGHVDRLNMLAPPFSMARGIVNGPYRVATRAVNASGAARAELYMSGAQAHHAQAEQ